MKVVNVTSARNDIYNIIDMVNAEHEPVCITGKSGNAILLAEDDWNIIADLLRNSCSSNIDESILKGSLIPITECIPEEKVKW